VGSSLLTNVLLFFTLKKSCWGLDRERERGREGEREREGERVTDGESRRESEIGRKLKEVESKNAL